MKQKKQGNKYLNAIPFYLAIFFLGVALGYAWCYHHNQMFEKNLKIIEGKRIKG